MFLKKIPPINIVLFVVMLGVVGASIYGFMQFVEEADDPENNYVESSYNSSLSQHYTDSFSRTPIGKLGKIEISVYDSIENMNKPFVLCRIITHKKNRWRDTKNQVMPVFLAVFPYGTWFGEFNYQIRQPNYFRSTTVPLHPIQLTLTNDKEDGGY